MNGVVILRVFFYGLIRFNPDPKKGVTVLLPLDVEHFAYVSYDGDSCLSGCKNHVKVWNRRMLPGSILRGRQIVIKPITADSSSNLKIVGQGAKTDTLPTKETAEYFSWVTSLA